MLFSTLFKNVPIPFVLPRCPPANAKRKMKVQVHSPRSCHFLAPDGSPRHTILSLHKLLQGQDHFHFFTIVSKMQETLAARGRTCSEWSSQTCDLSMHRTQGILCHLASSVKRRNYPLEWGLWQPLQCKCPSPASIFWHRAAGISRKVAWFPVINDTIIVFVQTIGILEGEELAPWHLSGI